MEEAYELADAAHAGDDARLLDELGDVLFQVHFLALLLEERGAGDLAAVAEHCCRKLIRRHPHVFGEVEADDAATVLRNWDAIKRTEKGGEPGAAGALPGNLPATIYARKTQRRAAAAGDPQPDVEAALARVVEEARRLTEAPAVERVPPGGEASVRAAEAEEAEAEAPAAEEEAAEAEPPAAETQPPAAEAEAGEPDAPAPGPEAVRPAGDPLRDERFDSIGELLYGAVAAARELGVDAELALRAAADRRALRAAADRHGEPAEAPVDGDERQP